MPEDQHRRSRAKALPKTKTLYDLGCYERVLQAFRQNDLDGNGTISRSELDHLMKALNKGHWSDMDTTNLCASLDRDRNGKIDIDEFVSFIFPRPTSTGGTDGMSEYERVMDYFRASDVNRNGTMDPQEFSRLMSALRGKGQWHHEWTEKLWRKLDLNGSGEVDSSELISYLFDVPMPQLKPQRPRKSHSRSMHPAAPRAALEIVCGPGPASTNAALIRSQWLKMFGDSLLVTLVCDQGTRHIQRVSTPNGKLVLWDRGTMVAYREDPFADLQTMRTWTKNVAQRDIPRLLGAVQEYL